MVISFYPNFGWGFLLSESQKKNAPTTQSPKPLGAILRDTLKQIVVTKNKNKIAYYKYTYYICTYNLTRQII